MQNSPITIPMKWSRLWLSLALLWLPNVASAETPTPPGLSRELASRLPALARKAMLEYLANRTLAQNIPLPQNLPSKDLVNGKTVSLNKIKYPVILTLRHKGKSVARCFEQNSTLVHNTIVAALRAMRSRSLPDRVTRAYLESLTIELEIPGLFVPVEEEQIGRELRPGLEGLKLAVGVDDPRLKGPHFEGVFQEAIVTPATAYLLGWNTARIKKQCLFDIHWRSENQTLPRQWSRFNTLHYVAYPDGKYAPTGAPTGTWLLYRGKILLPPLPRSDANARHVAVKQVGDFLLRGQNASGQYTLPKGKTSTTEQLYAAWAMAKLGKSLEKNGQAYLDSAKAALGYVAKQYVKLDVANKQACVFTVNPRQEVLATAMFVLAAAEDSQHQTGRDVVTNMLAFLRSRMNEQGRFLDAEGKVLDDVSAAAALLALQTPAPNPSDEQWRDGVEALLYDSGLMGATGGKTKPLSAVGQAWLGRAILAGKCGREGQYRNFVSRFAARILRQQRQEGAPADTVGAVTTAAGRADTLATALSMVLLHQMREAKPAVRDAEPIAAAVAEGQSFCRQMTYRPEEAYFTPSPFAWRGAVRQRADAADVSLNAAAGVIEAMLLK